MQIVKKTPGLKKMENRTYKSPFKPTTSLCGMKDLDIKLFKQDVTVPAFVVFPKSISLLLKNFHRYLLCIEKMKHVQPCPSDKTKKLILLDPNVYHKEPFTDEQCAVLKEHSVQCIFHEISLSYENYSKDEVLYAVLPENIGDITTTFETVGHIAHMNLREREQEYKKVIGKVILDKTPTIRTVVNKTNSIDSTYRNFRMELLAGEDDMIATVNEEGCTFRFDFSKVFWNSRLQIEHKRLIDMIKPVDTVYDVFAGVGPFAIPAAKKGCTVFANDLNPHSFDALNDNVKLNKVQERVHIFNQDGLDFIRMFIKREVALVSNQSRKEGSYEVPHEKTPKMAKTEGRIHVVMNLPATAIDFLHIFQLDEEFSPGDLVDSETDASYKKPAKELVVHCYCFSKSETPCKDVRLRIGNILSLTLDSKGTEFYLVRDVAPKKVMVCATFVLPWNLMCCKVINEGDKNELQQRGVKRSYEEEKT